MDGCCDIRFFLSSSAILRCSPKSHLSAGVRGMRAGCIGWAVKLLETAEDRDIHRDGRSLSAPCARSAFQTTLARPNAVRSRFDAADWDRGG